MREIVSSIKIRVTKEMEDQINLIAKESGISKSSTCRMLIAKSLNDEVVISSHSKIKWLSTCPICNKPFEARNNKKYCCFECSRKAQYISRKNWEYQARAKSASVLTPADIKEIRSAEYCFYCNEKLTDGNKTIDHFIPISKGGTNDKSNLVCCCMKCNSSKGGKTYEEWIASKEVVNV